MELDCKKMMIIVFLSNLVVILCTVVAQKQWEQLGHDTINDPGRLADPSLKFVAVLFRHGNRAPEISYKTDPYINYFPEGKGELTKLGKQNMYKKGKLLRLLYNGFLSDLYLDSEILIQTTNVARTFMSAALVLAGMYPPKDYQKWLDEENVWQPIPINQNSPDHGLIFREHCPSFVAISKDILSYKSEKNLTALLSYLSEKTGQSITEMDLVKLHDLFECQISAGLQLPEWIIPDKFQTLKSIVLQRKRLDNFFGNSKVQKLVIGPLLKEIALTMESHSNNSISHNKLRKMYLYSGHDISLATVKGFFMNIVDMPDFGASIHFHLYLDKTLGYIVKIFSYNRWDMEKKEELSIHACGNPCKLQNFINIVKTNFPRGWNEECQIMEN